MAVLDTSILVNYYFEEICKIPHGSYNEAKIADYKHTWIWLMKKIKIVTIILIMIL